VNMYIVDTEWLPPVAYASSTSLSAAAEQSMAAAATARLDELLETD
jgi:hypothetical protein